MKYQILLKSLMLLLLVFFVSSVAHASGYNMYSPYGSYGYSSQNTGGGAYCPGLYSGSCYGSLNPNAGYFYNGWSGGSSAQGGGYLSKGIFDDGISYGSYRTYGGYGGQW